MNQIRSRIAPTPSGYLHIGNAVNFVITWLYTRKQNGHLALRIDDMDATRSRREYIEDVFKSIDWLKLDYDSGPQSVEEFEKDYSQLNKKEYYRGFLTKLSPYACECSRKQIKELSSDGYYQRTCREKNLIYQEGIHSLRFKIDSASSLYKEGDFVIWRKDNLPAYQLVSVIEDIDNKINLIIRGKDLLYSTNCQKLIANRFEENDFEKAQFIHHDLILDKNGNKLSKSKGANSLNDLRERNIDPEIVYKEVAKLLSIDSNKIHSLEDLLNYYELNSNPL